MSNIYLISNPVIDDSNFAIDLKNILATNLVKAFQLRLKGYKKLEIEKIAKNLQKICRDYDCSFIINDHPDIALNNDIDGVHLGQDDLLQYDIAEISQKLLIGISCYDKIDLALKAQEMGASYISFGAFFPTITKKSPGTPKIDIISKFSKISSLPIVAIGGINDTNCVKIVNEGADFIAVISYVWNSDNKVNNIKILHDKINKR